MPSHVSLSVASVTMQTHKNDHWQGYAAITAAAYAKELVNSLSFGVGDAPLASKILLL